MRITKLSMMLLGTLSFAALLNGCGSSSKESAISAGDIAKVNEATCLGCHASWTEKITGDAIVANYNTSKHNLNYVGCQDCHGGGSMHSGVGPMPYPQPGNAQCASCHTTITPAFVNGNHGPANFTIEFAEDEAHRICSRCHTHEGALLGGASGYTGDLATLKANAGKAPGLDPDGSKSQGMKCVTCHVTHKTDELRVPNTVVAGEVVPWQPATMVDGATASTNKQFNLCTSCHNYTTPTGSLIANGNNGTAEYYHSTSWYRILGTTHWDDPATTDKIEGYVLRTNGPSPCYDCHAHEAKAGTRRGDTTTPTIYTDWARSGHGGGLLDAKYAAAKANPQTGTRGTDEYTTTGKAQVDAVLAANSDGAAYSWGHYPWQTAGRAGCQKCHTATGAANYMKSPSTYNAANNDFSHLAAGQQELLYCWGCHSNAGTGALNNPGAVKTEYKYNAADITLPDAGKSNGCLVCHSGRGNVQSARSTRFAGHHAPTGADIFAEFTHVGFEFTGQNYAKPAYFAHDKVGMSNGAGPCVGCHMNSASHSFGVVTKDANGLITAITTQAVCNTCHTGQYAMTAAKLEEEGEGYREAGVLLKAYLSNTIVNYHNKPIINSSGAPIDSTGAKYAVPDLTKTPPLVAGTVDINLMPVNDYGAYQNSMYPTEDPGGFAHNRYYVKRLLFDSIDVLDNGVLDGTITINATTYPKAAAWLGTSRP